jgi:hypothetical protein
VLVQHKGPTTTTFQPHFPGQQKGIKVVNENVRKRSGSAISAIKAQPRQKKLKLTSISTKPKHLNKCSYRPPRIHVDSEDEDNDMDNKFNDNSEDDADTEGTNSLDEDANDTSQDNDDDVPPHILQAEARFCYFRDKLTYPFFCFFLLQ